MITKSYQDTVINIQGYNLIHRDRTGGQHGGVCIYIKDLINCESINDLNNDQFDVLWINLHMSRLPRAFNNLVIGTVYHPSSTDGPPMLDYLSSFLSTFESCFPSCGLIILGDFNRLSISRLIHHYNLHQLINFPMKRQNVPFGLSDHMCVVLKPKERSLLPKLQKIITKKGTCDQAFILHFIRT
jgi:exonuclease III